MTKTAAGDEAQTITTSLCSSQLLADPLLNKGTAFSESERDAFDLHGLLPPSVVGIEEQVARRLQALRKFSTDLERYAFLRELQDTNETLYYALLTANLEELLPIVYTPTVGEGCQQFSHLFRKPRGLFLSPPHQERIAQILANKRFDRTEVIVVTDGERILGLGDQGAGGMGIPIGKLALYTACGGIAPGTTLPVILDVGTDNPACRNDPLYIGWRHERIRGAEYDDFVEAFIAAVSKRWPHVLLQWEDFAKGNASRLLDRYRDRLCTFNDDIQGTAAVATGALLAAINVTGVPLREQRIAVLGSGSAGCGIANLLLHCLVDAGLSQAEAARRFYMIDSKGLMVDRKDGVLPFQQRFVQQRDAVAGWTLQRDGRIDLIDVVKNARPSTLIGVSGQAGAFTEDVVRAMAQQAQRPVIFPLSNPTSHSEATPADLVAWTGGRAVIGTGSPFPPILRDGRSFKVDQTNNAYIFPGVGLGAIAMGARRITDSMFMAAAKALAEASPARQNPQANLLPPVTALRQVALAVAQAVALQVHKERLGKRIADDRIEAAIRAKVWTPQYLPYRRRRRR